MRVSVTIGTEDGEYVAVDAEHDMDAFSGDVLDSLLQHASVQARALALAKANDTP